METSPSVFRKKYRDLSEEERVAIEDVKVKADELLLAFTQTIHSQPHVSDRTMALAKTRLEEAVMWAVKGITE